MVDVLNSSFNDWLPEIKKSIESASFIALDFEFLGLPSSRNDPEHIPTLFDDMDERYRKVVSSVRRYPPCQMGIACFREEDDGRKYRADTFCLPLFKRVPRKVFAYSLSAMSFLAKNGFDFNKFIAEGITYANHREVDALQKDILSGEIDYDILEDGLEHRLQLLKMNLQVQAAHAERAAVASGAFQQARRARTSLQSALSHGQHGSNLQLWTPVLIELVRSNEFVDTDTLDQSLHPPWDRPLTNIEVATLVYALSNEHRHLEFHVNNTRTMLYCAEIPLIVRNSVSEEGRIARLLKELLKEVSGASEVVKAIVDRKAPLVGHNSFLDLLYTYECFIGDLPDSYREWKKAVRRLFPEVYDTKIIACALKSPLSENGLYEHSLQTLGTFFDSPSCGQILPFAYPLINDGLFASGLFSSGEHYHNAAFDAKVTGSVFVKLLYVYAFTKSAGLSDFSRLWPLRKLLFACRTTLANRIPLPLIDFLHCHLAGDDPIGKRPAPLRARRRRAFPLLTKLGLPEGGAATGWIDWMADIVMSLPQISELVIRPVRAELKRELGAFRVDVQLSDEEAGVVLVATNTPKTYARVARYLCGHEWLKLIDTHIEGVDFDELLMGASTNKKKKKYKRTPRKRTVTTMDDEEDGMAREEKEQAEGTAAIGLWTAGFATILASLAAAAFFKRNR